MSKMIEFIKKEWSTAKNLEKAIIIIIIVVLLLAIFK